MKVCLVITPFCTLNYIPLGISQLKSYIEKKVPSVQVCNIDLNNAFLKRMQRKEFLYIVEELACLHQGDKTANSKTYDMFRHRDLFNIAVNGLKNKEEFYDSRKYNVFIKIARAFFVQCEQTICSIAKYIFENSRELPLVLKRIFHDDAERIFKIGPAVVGFSIFSRHQLAYSLILAKILKEKRKKIPIIFGGAFMSYIDTREFLNFFDFIDFVIDREGESGLTEFIQRIQHKHHSFNSVPNLSYRVNGKVVKNKDEFINCLDDLPFPDFGDLQFSDYFFPDPVIPIMFSRGCFWRKCTFCVYHRHYPVGYKTKSIDRLIREVSYYRKQGFRYFFFMDEMISADHLNSISLALAEENLDIFFGALVKPTKDFSYNRLKNIYKAGGRVLIWGVESSSQKLLDLMRKGTNIKDIKLTLKNSHRVGFFNYVFMIRGFPMQTEDQIYKDIRFLQANREFIDSFSMHNFLLEKDSYIFNHSEKYCIYNIKESILYKKKDSLLKSGLHFFRRKNELDWQRINRKTNEIFGSALKNRFPIEFVPYEYTDVLLHASLKC
jgi:radical SAM superfamily enzyme YgiQ (UPF0313 family)